MKLHKIGAFIAVGFIMIGIVLLTIGSSWGGGFHDTFGVHYGDADFSIGIGSAKRDRSQEDDIAKRNDLTSFSHLYMDIDIGDITVKRGKVLALTTENLSSADYTLTQDDDTVTITAKQQDFHLLSLYHPDYEYTLTVPEDMVLDTLSVQSHMGDVSLESIAVKDIDIQQDMGDIELEDVVYDHLKLDQKMGDISYEGRGGGDMECENAMGDIAIMIKDDRKKYAYDLSTAMGSIKTDEEQCSGASQSIAADTPHASYRLNMNCSMGDIHLEFDDDFD